MSRVAHTESLPADHEVDVIVYLAVLVVRLWALARRVISFDIRAVAAAQTLLTQRLGGVGEGGTEGQERRKEEMRNDKGMGGMVGMEDRERQRRKTQVRERKKEKERTK